MNNPQIIKIIENLKGRRAYEEKRASKLGFSSLYAYIEDKILKKKVFEESKVIQNKIKKDNPEKIKKEKKIVALAANLRSRTLFRTIFNSFPVQLPFSSPCK